MGKSPGHSHASQQGKFLGRAHARSYAMGKSLGHGHAEHEQPSRSSRQGKYEQAEEMHRQVSRLSEKVLGKEHRDTVANMNNSAPGIDDSDVASICSIDWPNLD